MHFASPRNYLFAALLSALTFAPASSFANSALMRAEVSPSLIDFQVVSEYQALVVRVSGQGYDFEQRFEASEAATFAPSQFNLPDGTYTYEAVVIPPAAPADEERVAVESEVSSGAFTLQGGSLVDPTMTERPEAASPADPNGVQGVAANTQFFTDDLSVKGSACVGFDCESNQTFGFDTLLLKENNLRIKFQDTSASASFPSNDWALIANDTNNGGSNHFSIEDVSNSRLPFRIGTDAPSNSLVIEADTGHIGIGTATPGVHAHIVDGDSPTLRLEQDGSSGFTAQSWDLAGNETNFFVRDVTNGSKLPFRIKPGAPDNSLFVAANADVGLGTENPSGDLTIHTKSAGANVDLDLTSTNSWRFRSNGSNGSLSIIDNTASTAPMRILAGTDSNLLTVGGEANGTPDSDRVTISGELFVGTSQVTPDYVFEHDYDLLSIDEQAEFMNANKHLPSIKAANQSEDGLWQVNVGHRSQGMLEELEKAHLYIVQLHERLAARETQLEDVLSRLERLEDAGE